MAAVSELSVSPSPGTDGVPAALFRNVLGHFPTGVTVITGRAGERPVGMAVGSFFSLSLDPLLVGFCAAKTSSSWSEIKRFGRFCANVLAHDQQALCRTFAVSGGDKFREVGWEPRASGTPRLDGVLAWVECTIEAVHDGGDHEICIGRVRALGIEQLRTADLLSWRALPEFSVPPPWRRGTCPPATPSVPSNSTLSLTNWAAPARLALFAQAPAMGMISVTGTLKFGATYPTLDLGTDPAVLRDWAVGMESIGFDEIVIPEHVVGINAGLRPDWEPLNPNTLKKDKPIYDHTNPFFEPFVAMGFLAAVTSRIMLTSGVMIAPQRQTALIAKQAAIADVLSRGRIRLGIGVGWNDAEFQAMGADFRVRGRRMDEQIDLLRRLWTEESVTYSGRFDTLEAAGVCPMPIQRPIPLIIGGDSDPALERAASRGDGWFLTHTAAECADRTSRFWKRVDELGRRDDMSLVGTIYQGPRPAQAMLDEAAAWADLGATHLNIRTATYPIQWSEGKLVRKTDVDEHLEALRDLRQAWHGSADA